MKAAYIGAVLVFTAKRPKLETFLIPAPKSPRRPQTWQEQIQIAKQWSVATAGR